MKGSENFWYHSIYDFSYRRLALQCNIDGTKDHESNWVEMPGTSIELVYEAVLKIVASSETSNKEYVRRRGATGTLTEGSERVLAET